MIVSLTGKIVSYSNGELHLDVNGVGYGSSVSKSIASLPLQPGNELTVLTHLDVKENSMLLFGFSDEREREIFKLLLTVSGVGTKLAHTIISHLNFNEIVGLISGNISTRSIKIPGLGQKKIELISMTLKDKIFKIDSLEKSADGISTIYTDSEKVRIETLNALLNLGFQRQEAEKIIRDILKNNDAHKLSTEELLKRALNS